MRFTCQQLNSSPIFGFFVSRLVSQLIIQERGNAWRACLGKVSRAQYLRRYPIRLIQPDGSSIEILASEPRKTVQLAVDLKTLSDEERRQRLAARKPKVKKIKEETIDDNFDATDYMKYWSSGRSSIEIKSKLT